MRLPSLPTLSSLKPSSPRRTRTFRPSLAPALEGLEQRTVLSGATAALVASAHAHALAPAATNHSPLTITSATVSNLAVTGANTLSGVLNLAGTLNTRTSSVALPPISIPITASLTPTGMTSAAGTPILNLSLHIPDLNLLGLHVRLDDCNGGPVTVGISAIPGGGLLGDLLSGVAGSTTGLLGLVGGQTSTVTGGLTEVLNRVLTDVTSGGIVSLLNGGTGGTPAAGGTGMTDTIPAGDTELVDLHLGPIHADILGLDITTSQICLNVYADPHGGLLGSLLSSLDNLLNNHGNTGHAQNVLLRNLLRDLTALGL